MRSLSLKVAWTWDGVPLLADEVALVEVAFTDGLTLTVDAPFHGDPAPPGAVGRADRLWENEVVELFVAEAPRRDARYLELELGPHGHWLALAFDGYRRRRLDDLVIAHVAMIDGPRWRSTARLTGAELARAIDHVGAVNAYAIHGAAPTRRFLAARPAPAGRFEAPDFHRLEHFVVLAGP